MATEDDIAWYRARQQEDHMNGPYPSMLDPRDYIADGDPPSAAEIAADERDEKRWWASWRAAYDRLDKQFRPPEGFVFVFDARGEYEATLSGWWGEDGLFHLGMFDAAHDPPYVVMRADPARLWSLREQLARVPEARPDDDLPF